MAMMLLTVSSRGRCGPSTACGAVAVVLLSTSAAAQEKTLTTAEERAADAASRRSDDEERPHTETTGGVGMLTLPSRKVCIGRSNNCSRGHTYPSVRVWMLYRFAPELAVGAGAGFAHPLSAQVYEETEDYERQHTRNYVWLEGMGRYYGLRLSSLQGWFGITTGVVIVSDVYEARLKDQETAILGRSGVVLRTEGLSFGMAWGLDWNFVGNWLLQGTLQSSMWLLPKAPACGPTKECATLSGDMTAFTAGIHVGYKIAL